MGRTFSQNREGRIALPTGKIPIEKPRCKWKDNNRLDVKEIGANTRNWVD